MSKIQKALQELRSRQGGGADEEPRLPSIGQESETFTVGEYRRGDHGNFPEERSLFDGADTGVAIVPAREAAVDVSRLRSAGILPSKKYDGVVFTQFQRAKRPLVAGAFQLGIPIGDNSNIVMVASPMPSAGKSFCSFNLALSVARERDFGTVLVDADVLNPHLTAELGLGSEPGLIDYLVEPELSIEEITFSTDLHDVIVIPAGRRHPDAAEYLSSNRMRKLVAALSSGF